VVGKGFGGERLFENLPGAQRGQLAFFLRIVGAGEKSHGEIAQFRRRLISRITSFPDIGVICTSNKIRSGISLHAVSTALVGAARATICTSTNA
jgi:hypothetical protein